MVFLKKLFYNVFMLWRCLMPFESLELREDISISKVVTIHYFEYMSDFSFPGESHNFWEFLCVDKGEVDIMAGDRPHTLKRGQIAFHKPNEFHSLKANGRIAPNLVVISFECNSPAMQYFEELITDISETARYLMAQIIYEARRCIATPLDDPYTTHMERLPEAAFGSEQLIKLYLEQLLIYLVREQMKGRSTAPAVVKSIKQKNDAIIYKRITTYLEEHIREHLTIDEICRANLIGRSQLQKLFREQNQCGVIEYFSRLKIELAKQLIRENHHNFTQISDFLGYTSIHYFSRQFKKLAGMTPSEYASSIKLLAERP